MSGLVSTINLTSAHESAALPRCSSVMLPNTFRSGARCVSSRSGVHSVREWLGVGQQEER